MLTKFLSLNLSFLPDIRMDWETYNIDQKDRKLVDVLVAYGDAFPVKDTDGNEVISGAMRLSDGNTQTAWEQIHTTSSEGTSGSVQSVTVSTLTPHHNTDTITFSLMTHHNFITRWPLGNSYGYDASKQAHMKCIFYWLKPSLRLSISGCGRGGIFN